MGIHLGLSPGCKVFVIALGYFRVRGIWRKIDQQTFDHTRSIITLFSVTIVLIVCQFLLGYLQESLEVDVEFVENSSSDISAYQFMNKFGPILYWFELLLMLGVLAIRPKSQSTRLD